MTYKQTNSQSKVGPPPLDQLSQPSGVAIRLMTSTDTGVVSVLALSGSLRAKSLNTAMLRMAAQCAPRGLSVLVHTGLGQLPLFNPDLDDPVPPAVAYLRSEIAAADGILIASPEYAHGVSGILKNGLDWMVGSSALVNKPIALWNAAPRASHGLAAVRETLGVMSAVLVTAADIALLIQPGPSGQPPNNPDNLAMTSALESFMAEIHLLRSLDQR
jgi:NAD(P)H-dependent FMN reductase